MADGLFDDLIPLPAQAARTPAPAAAAPGLFDDLVPAAPDYSAAFRDDVGTGEALVRGYAAGGANVSKASNLLLGMPTATLIDKVHGLLSGREETGARDTVGGWIDDNSRQIQELALDPRRENAGLGDEVAFGAANAIPDLAATVLTGGEHAAVTRAPQALSGLATLREAVARELYKDAAAAGRASVAPALEHGTTRAAEVVDAGGSTPEALAAGTGTAGATALANVLPASASGRVAVRAAQGAVANPVADYLQTALENASVDDRLGLDRGYTLKDAAVSALTGAPLAAGLGERGPEPIRQPERGALDLADLQPPPATPAPAAAAAAPRQGEPAPRGPGPSSEPAQVAAQQRMQAQRAAAGDVQRPAPPITNPAPPAEPVRAPEPQGDVPPPDRLRFASPAEHHTNDFVTRATGRGVPEDIARELAPEAPIDSVTGFYDGTKGELDRSIQRAQQHVETTGEDAVYVSADIANLGGLNAHVGNRREDANAHYRAMTDAMRSELEAIGADVVPLRTGGDEIGAVVVNASQADVDAALARARSRIEQYAADNGLSAIPHPKGGAPGTGLHFGSAAIVPGVTIKDILDRADAGIDLGKTGGDTSVRSQPTQADASGAPAGAAAATGTAAPRDGVRPQGGEPAPAAPEPRPAPAEPVAQQEVAPPADAAPPRTTSLKNEVRNADREARGDDPLYTVGSRANQDVVDAARAEVEADPKKGRETVLRILGGDKASLHDEGVLLVEDVRQRQRRDAASDRMTDESLSDSERQAAREEWADAEAQIADIDVASRAVGAESARILQFRKRLIAQDYTLQAMERKAREARGRALTADEAAEVAAAHAMIADLQKQLDAAAAKAEDAQVEALLAELQRKAGVPAAAKKGRTLAETLADRAEAARARIASRDGIRTGNRQAGAFDIALMADYIDIGAYHVAKGIGDFTAFVKRMAEDVAGFAGFPVKRQQQVYDAASALASRARAADPAQVLDEIPPETEITRQHVVDLATAHIQAGKTGLAVLDAVAQDLQGAGHDIDAREVRRLFTEYGKARIPSQDAVQKELREVRALGQLQESIDRLEDGLLPLKSGPQRDKASEQVRAKRAEFLRRIKALASAGGADAEAYNRMREAALRKQIEAIDREIMVGEKAAKQGKGADLRNTEVKRLEALRDQLKDERDALLGPAPKSADQRYNERMAKQLQRRLAELRQRLQAKDFAPRTRTPKPLSAEIEKLAFRVAQAKADFARAQFEAQMAARPPLKKILGGAVEAQNFARAVQTSVDFSALLRQAGFIAFGHPARAARAAWAGARAALSAQAEHTINDEVANRPNAALYKRAGLHLTEHNSHDITKLEEQFVSRWLDKVPGFAGGGLLRGSQRAYTTTLNRIRADSFDAMVAALALKDAPTDAEVKAIANYINVATGRGVLGPNNKFANAAPALSTVFFAPRLVASRFNLLAGQPLYGGSARTRKLVAQEYARFLMGMGVVYGLGYLYSLATDEDDDGIVTFDPRSSDFGKLRFGNTYLDPLTGLAQVTAFVGKEVAGEKITTKGDLKPLRAQGKPANLFRAVPETKGPGYGQDDTTSVLGRFLRTKLAPVPGALVDLNQGENVIGERVTPTDAALQLVVPLSVRDIKDIMVDNGAAEGSALVLLSLLGMGVQYRAPKEKSEGETE